MDKNIVPQYLKPYRIRFTLFKGYKCDKQGSEKFLEEASKFHSPINLNLTLCKSSIIYDICAQGMVNSQQLFTTD